MHTNPPSPHASTEFAVPLARQYGNEIITNTLSVIWMNYPASANTFETIRCNGKRTMNIPIAVVNSWNRARGTGGDEFIVTPNHFHAIVNIVDCDGGIVGAQRRCAPTDRTDPPKPHVTPNSIGAIIRAYKSAVTARINRIRGTPGAPIWQRNYHACPPRISGETHHPRRRGIIPHPEIYPQQSQAMGNGR